jgi:hypothetical protein
VLSGFCARERAGCASSPYVFVSFPFHCLPFWSPKPSFVSWNGNIWTQLDHSIGPFNYFNLRTLFFKVKPAAERDW